VITQNPDTMSHVTNFLDELENKPKNTSPMSKFEVWLEKVNEERKEYWDENYSYREYSPLTYKKGRKYIKIIDEGSVWAFVSMKNGDVKGSRVKFGDLLKPASYNSPAKHARGNIFEGTARYTFWGPVYIK